MTDIQRTNYDAALAVAITDAERKVVEAAERLESAYEAVKLCPKQDRWNAFIEVHESNSALSNAVSELRRVRGDHA